MANHQDRIQRLHQLAEKVRTVAEGMHDLQYRRTMVLIAESYDQMAIKLAFLSQHLSRRKNLVRDLALSRKRRRSRSQNSPLLKLLLLALVRQKQSLPPHGGTWGRGHWLHLIPVGHQAIRVLMGWPLFVDCLKRQLLQTDTVPLTTLNHFNHFVCDQFCDGVIAIS
jgi:hypothetical protein